MEWPCTDGKLRPYPGTLHTMKSKRQFITFEDEERNKYHVESRQGSVVHLTQETVEQYIKGGENSFNIEFV